MEKTYTERLAKFILFAIYVAIAYFALKYFGSVVSYIILALVVSLIAKPLMGLLRKVKFRGRSLSDSFLAIFSILFILAALIAIISGPVPVIKKVLYEIAALGTGSNMNTLSSYLASFNRTLIETFKLAPAFKLEHLVLNELSSILNVNLFGNVIGTVASTFAGIAVAVFSVIFISFYLIKDETLSSRIINVLTPDKYVENAAHAQKEVQYLLSRYFVGLLIEMTCVGLIDFLGLWAVARLDFESALGIGFLAGILNFIPYIGPFIGTVLGIFMSLVVKFCSFGTIGANMGFWGFVLILLAIFMFAQLVDNFVFQPVIYSTSIKAKPLEIFIVMLLAASVGGMIGMLLAIPAYTVVRVIAINFFPDNKIVKALTN